MWPKNVTRLGITNPRRARNSSGKSGSAVWRSTTANTARATGLTANPATTIGWPQPHSGPRLMAMSNPVTASPKLTAPPTSKRTSGLRAVSGSSGMAASRAISDGTAWM